MKKPNFKNLMRLSLKVIFTNPLHFLTHVYKQIFLSQKCNIFMNIFLQLKIFLRCFICVNNIRMKMFVKNVGKYLCKDNPISKVKNILLTMWVG